MKFVRSLLVAAALAAAFVAPLAVAQDHEPHGHDGHAHDGQTHAAATGEAHEGEHHGLDWTVLAAQFINLAILLGIFYKLGASKLSTFLAERKNTIEKEIVAAREIKTAAEAKYKEYTSRLAELDKEIEKLKVDMQKAGEAERDRIVADAEAKAERMRKDTEFIIEQQFKQLRVDLTKETAAAAIAAAEKILTTGVTGTDQDRLSREYLTELTSNASAMRQS